MTTLDLTFETARVTFPISWLNFTSMKCSSEDEILSLDDVVAPRARSAEIKEKFMFFDGCKISSSKSLIKRRVSFFWNKRALLADLYKLLGSKKEYITLFPSTCESSSLYVIDRRLKKAFCKARKLDLIS